MIEVYTSTEQVIRIFVYIIIGIGARNIFQVYNGFRVGGLEKRLV